MRTGISRAVLAAAAVLSVPLLAPAGDPKVFVPVTPAVAALPPGTVPAVSEMPAVQLPPVPEPNSTRWAAPPAPGKVMVFQRPAGNGAQIPAKDPDPNTLNPRDVRSIYETYYGKLPGKLEVFRLESEAALETRIRRELEAAKVAQVKKAAADEGRKLDEKQIKVNIIPEFPAPPELSAKGVPYVPKTIAYPPVKAMIEPGYVVHRRLYFEDKNSERFGWDLGFAQPMVSALEFYKDVLVFPAKLASNPHERYDTNLGKCLPGSPVPYYLYPPEIDIWGATFAAGMYTGTAFFFP